MGSRWTAVIFALVITPGFFLHFTDGMRLCEFEEKFPGSAESCFKKQGKYMELSTADSNEPSTTRESTTEKLATTESSTSSTEPSDTLKASKTDESNEPTTEMKTTTDVLTTISCPRNMVYGICTCRGTCDDPGGSTGCHSDCGLGTEWCYCPDGFLIDGNECVPFSECLCFWSEIDQVIPIGQTKSNNDCTERRTCTSNGLVIDSKYRCASHATCDVQDGERRCYCDDGYHGDGQSCESYTDCYDAYNDGHSEDGVYLIKPSNWSGPAFNVSCRMNTNGGGWTVFQRRTGTDRQTSFYRNWTNYKDGFGSLNGDFWLGNEKLNFLTTQKTYKLRVDIVGSSNSSIYEERSSFSVGSEENKYRLSISGYSGNTGSQYFDYNNGKKFSTFDQDNDECGRHDCAEKHRSGWWYSDYWCFSTYNPRCYQFDYESTSTSCTHTNLNGEYNGGNGENIYWFSNSHSDHCNLNFAEMKIRPTN